MVFVGYGCPKQRHKAIAQKLVDGTFIAMDLVQCQFKESVQEGVHVFGTDAFSDGSGIGEITKEHRHLFAFAFEGAPGGQNSFGKVLGGIGKRFSFWLGHCKNRWLGCGRGCR